MSVCRQAKRAFGAALLGVYALVTGTVAAGYGALFAFGGAVLVAVGRLAGVRGGDP